MSLHAPLSPETRDRLAAQRRTSTLTSLVIALLGMVLIGVILMIIAMTAAPFKSPLPQYRTITNTPAEQPTLKKTTVSIKRIPNAPSSFPNTAIVVPTASNVSLPITQYPTKEIDIGFGEGIGTGEGGFDRGEGPGNAFKNIPDGLSKRCSQADRLDRLTRNGGSEACETAVVSSLRWLKETQTPDGSWTQQKPVAMTGLALLAFLGHCETAGSAEFGEAVLTAINFLVANSLQNDGKLASDFKDDHWCYEHAIATYALAEAYTLCVKSFGENIPQLKETVMATGQFLINSQHQGGGWDYGYREDSGRGGDVSIVGWHLQALKACKITGLDFANLKKCSRKALDYLERKQAASGAFGYTSAASLHGDGTTLAAVGALCFQIWESPADRAARKAVRFLDQEMSFAWNTPDSDLYGHYYAVQCMLNEGGKTWEKYNAMFRDEVLNNQDPDGSFKAVGGGQKIKAVGASFATDAGHGRHYRTCLATLMLESYYRFLPTGQGK